MSEKPGEPDETSGAADVQPESAGAVAGAGGPSAEELRRAMKAFKKRLKLSRLDDESRLGHGAMTKGGRSGIVAIPAPAQYRQAVWDELTRQNKIRRAGHGLYELVEEVDPERRG